MSVNSSSSPLLSILPPLLSSSNFSSLHLFWCTCSRSEFSLYVFTILSTVNFLLLLLYLLILYLSFKKWRRRRRVATATLTHSDLFTFHSIVMKLNEWLGVVLFFAGPSARIILAGHYVCSTTIGGQSLFHLLTCVERYLAVVHPIAYRGLRPAARVWVRDVSSGCVWGVSLISLVVCYLSGCAFNPVLYFCTTLCFLGVATFCSISVLWVLRRPGPGAGGGSGRRVDRLRRRAFHTIAVIMAALLLRFGGNVITTVLYNLLLVERCTWIVSSMLLDLPSGLVLPLLFLHRLQTRRRVTMSPQGHVTQHESHRRLRRLRICN